MSISLVDWCESSESCFCKDTWIVESSVLVQAVDRFHVVLRDFEVVKAEVFDLSLWLDTLWNNSGAALDTPSEKNLRFSLLVLRGETLDYVVRHK